jgi:hypothetical protein
MLGGTRLLTLTGSGLWQDRLALQMRARGRRPSPTGVSWSIGGAVGSTLLVHQTLAKTLGLKVAETS